MSQHGRARRGRGRLTNPLDLVYECALLRLGLGHVVEELHVLGGDTREMLCTVFARSNEVCSAPKGYRWPTVRSPVVYFTIFVSWWVFKVDRWTGKRRFRRGGDE